MVLSGGRGNGRIVSSTTHATASLSKPAEDTGIFSTHWEPPPTVAAKRDCVWRVGQRLTVRADFESANLGSAEVVGSSQEYSELVVRTRPDCAGTAFETTNKSWFYFAVHGATPGEAMRVTVANLNKQAKLFGGGFKPVYRVFNRCNRNGRGDRGRWRRVGGELEFNAEVKGDFRVSFQFPGGAVRGTDDEVFFAFAIPWSVSENATSLARAERRFHQAGQPFIFTREKLCVSLEGRPVEVLTITSTDGDRASRPVFVVTSRVHPGETPASHMCNGVIDFLLRVRDERACAARRAFVFKIVSLLNPDGVANGNYRCDTRGINLNRCYEDPDPGLHPTVFAVKSLIVSDAPFFVIDLHAHANKKGCFAFGNAIPNMERRAECICFAKLAAMNCAYFDFSACNFTERNMMSRDKGGSTTKEGSARVAMYRETGITHIYTVEANYNSGRVQSGNFTIEADVLAACPLRAAPNGKGTFGGPDMNEGRCGATSPSSPSSSSLLHSSYSPFSSSSEYDESSFASMGRCLVLAALDLIDANPASTMRRWSLKSLSALRCWAQQHVRKVDTMSGGSSAPGFSFGKPPPLPPLPDGKREVSC